MKQRRYIAEVFKFRALLQGGKHLLEDVVSFTDAGIKGDTDGLRGLRSLCIDSGMFPLEMHPVDGPVAVGICSVSMRYAHRQDDILVSLNRIFATVDRAPTTAVSAINQHILVDAFRAVAIMVLVHGIVANIGDVETMNQWVDGFLGNGL